MKYAIPLWLILITATLCVSTAFGQVKYVDLSNGKKVVLKGRVRRDAPPFYAFDGKPGQQLIVRLISSDPRVVFSVDVVYNIQGQVITSEQIVDGKRSWTGPLPDANSDQFGVGVSTRAGHAAFTLEITLREARM